MSDLISVQSVLCGLSFVAVYQRQIAQKAKASYIYDISDIPFWVRVMAMKVESWWSDSSLQVKFFDRSSIDTFLKTRNAVISFLSSFSILGKETKQKGKERIQMCWVE